MKSISSRICTTAYNGVQLLYIHNTAAQQRTTAYNGVQRRTTSYNVETLNARLPLKHPPSTPTCIRTKYRRNRDLRAVKISALYDLWRTKRRQKNKTSKNPNVERPSTPQESTVRSSNSTKTCFRRSPTLYFSTPKHVFFPDLFRIFFRFFQVFCIILRSYAFLDVTGRFSTKNYPI